MRGNIRRNLVNATVQKSACTISKVVCESDTVDPFPDSWIITAIRANEMRRGMTP